MRIGIVNDLKMAQEVLKQIVSAEHDIAWVAADGQEAVDKCKADLPDLVLMDLIMPVVDGVEATKIIMRDTPCPVLVVTATVEGNVSRVFSAMSEGALDAVNTPVFEDGELKGAEQLLSKISSIGKITHKDSKFRTTILSNLPQMVVIGASTGGPAVLSELLKNLPVNFPAALIIAQHVDSTFIHDFSRWLEKNCPLPCQVAKAGERPFAGNVYIANTEQHLYLNRSGVLDYTEFPQDYPYRPSINILFESFALNWERPGLAVLLTGMGEDGASGLLELKKSGWHTIAQDEASSVVYGMPKAAAQLGASCEVLPVTQIALKLLSYFN